MSTTANFGIVLLAGGGLLRLGQPKQLVPYLGKSLIQHAIDVSCPLHTPHKMLVLGAMHHEILDSVSLKGFLPVINQQWSSGIASSIKAGTTQALQVNPKMEHLLFLLSDQPHLALPILEHLIYLQQQHHTITACRYGDILGVPAVFHRRYFCELLGLEGDTGARKVIRQYIQQVQIVDFPKGTIDVDTPEDLSNLYTNANQQQ